MSDWSDERDMPEKKHFNGEVYWSIAKNDTKRLSGGDVSGQAGDQHQDIFP